MKIGIVGGGFVGTATSLLAAPAVECLVWDIVAEKRQPADLVWETFVTCDAFFVCVPTPAKVDGSVELGMVESAVAQLAPLARPIFLRSTVPIGTNDRLGTHSMPEFLTERNWRSDVERCPLWVLGSPSQHAQRLIQSLLTLAKSAGCIGSDRLECVTRQEAEACKYFRNAFLATKVSFFNEAESLCRATGASFETVRSLVCADPRIGDSHSQVPGPDGQRGFGGSCFPKDTKGLLAQYHANGVRAPQLEGTLARNAIERH